MEESELSSSLDIRGLPVRYRTLRPVCEQAARQVLLEHGATTYAISVTFVDDAEISRINEQSLNTKGPTDVIAFDLSEDGLPFQRVGDVYISIDTALENSARFRIHPEEEILRLVVHGVLHVLGYSDIDRADREKMTEAQEGIVKRFSEGLAT